MTHADIRVLDLGLYVVYWKSGGSSLAAVGMDEKGDRWLAPCNWVNVPTYDWSDVDRAVLIMRRMGPLTFVADYVANYVLNGAARYDDSIEPVGGFAVWTPDPEPPVEPHPATRWTLKPQNDESVKPDVTLEK